MSSHTESRAEDVACAEGGTGQERPRARLVALSQEDPLGIRTGC